MSEIRDADQFITLVDFHVDQLSGLTHSSGTVSFESIPAATGRADRAMCISAQHCVKQPPRPQFRAKSKNLMRNLEFEPIVEIDRERFAAIRAQHYARAAEMRQQSVEVKRIQDLKSQVSVWFDECLEELKKSENRKISQIRIDFPIGKVGEYRAVKKTMSEKLKTKLASKIPENSANHQYFDIAEKFCDFESM